MGFSVLYDPGGVGGWPSRVQPDHTDEEQRERGEDQTRPDGVEARRGSRTQVRYGDGQPREVREHHEHATRYRRRPNPPHKPRDLHSPLLSFGSLHAPNLADPRYGSVTSSVTKMPF